MALPEPEYRVRPALLAWGVGIAGALLLAGSAAAGLLLLRRGRLLREREVSPLDRALALLRAARTDEERRAALEALALALDGDGERWPSRPGSSPGRSRRPSADDAASSPRWRRSRGEGDPGRRSAARRRRAPDRRRLGAAGGRRRRDRARLQRRHAAAEAERPTLLAAGDSVVVVLDLSVSIPEVAYTRMRNAMNVLADSDARVGLVLFSDIAYEVLPAGSPPAELKPVIQFITPVPGENDERMARPVYLVDPWSNGFRGGTRISGGLEIAREMIEREGGAGSILLISDLDTGDVDHRAARDRAAATPRGADPDADRADLPARPRTAPTSRRRSGRTRSRTGSASSTRAA